MREKILRYRKEIIFGMLVFLIATTSFALGYLASGKLNRAPIIIEKCSDSGVAP
jgi:hypothetical protein